MGMKGLGKVGLLLDMSCVSLKIVCTSSFLIVVRMASVVTGILVPDSSNKAESCYVVGKVQISEPHRDLRVPWNSPRY